MRRFFSLIVFSSATLMLSGCTTCLPTPSNQAFIVTNNNDNTLNGEQLFNKTFIAHGGNELNNLRNVNVSLTGKWKQLIRRIQPLVTDFGYRVDSQERVLPKEAIYAAEYQGPSGNKSVFRTPNTIVVRYNNLDSQNSEVLSSSALTADSFHLFLLGPLAMEPWKKSAVRLRNENMNGRNHWRIHFDRKPGLGFASRDDVVLWIDPQTNKTVRVQITLFGHETTKRAHVEVDYLAFKKVENYIFPSEFFERVKAPIAIDAHTWQLTGLDINRDYNIDDIRNGHINGAKKPADTSSFK